jgi:hypothetical protein
LEVRVLRVAVTVSGRLDCTTCGTCVLANDKAVLDSQRATQARVGTCAKCEGVWERHTLGSASSTWLQ